MPRLERQKKLIMLLTDHKHNRSCPITTAVLISRANAEINKLPGLKSVLVSFERTRGGLRFFPYRLVLIVYLSRETIIVPLIPPYWAKTKGDLPTFPAVGQKRRTGRIR